MYFNLYQTETVAKSSKLVIAFDNPCCCCFDLSAHLRAHTVTGIVFTLGRPVSMDYHRVVFEANKHQVGLNENLKSCATIVCQKN